AARRVRAPPGDATRDARGGPRAPCGRSPGPGAPQRRARSRGPRGGNPSASRSRSSAGAYPPGPRRTPPALYTTRMRSKFIELTPELYEYVIAHGARQDELLADVERETEALGGIA